MKKKWYQRLAQEGFVDIENEKEQLKQYDRRTIAFENRDEIREFFMNLDSYLTHHPEIPSLHQKVLTLYSEGYYLKDIRAICQLKEWKLKKIIQDYKRMILGGDTGTRTLNRNVL